MAKVSMAERFSAKAALENEVASHHVWDTLQEGDKPRIHNIHGRLFQLWHPSNKEEGTKMPLSYALPFLKHEAFIVMDEKGNELKQQAPDADDVANIKLPPNMCVANLGELTLDALFSRAVQLPGGDRVSRNDGKEAIIEFVMAAGIPADVRKFGPGARSQPADDADNLLLDENEEDAGGADSIFSQTGVDTKPPITTRAPAAG